MKMKSCLSTSLAAAQIYEERPQAREVIVGIDVMFDYIKGEVVGATESPHAQAPQQGEPEIRNFPKQKKPRGHTQAKEHPAFEINQLGILKVSHRRLNRARVLTSSGYSSRSNLLSTH